MARRASPADCILLGRIQQLNRTLAANAVAEARQAESRAADHRDAMGRQAGQHVSDWVAYLTTGRVDPQHLQWLSRAVVDATQEATAAAGMCSRAKEKTEARARDLELASANLKQAESLAKTTSRHLSRRLEEHANRALEERVSLMWRAK